jgi:hypothetical protein
MLIHSSELALLVLLSITKPTTLTPKENAKTHSTPMLLEPDVHNMQCSIVISLMLMQASLNALKEAETQPPRNARVMQSLLLGLEKVLVAMKDLTRESSVETI